MFGSKGFKFRPSIFRGLLCSGFLPRIRAFLLSGLLTGFLICITLNLLSPRFKRINTAKCILECYLIIGSKRLKLRPGVFRGLFCSGDFPRIRLLCFFGSFIAVSLSLLHPCIEGINIAEVILEFHLESRRKRLKFRPCIFRGLFSAVLPRDIENLFFIVIIVRIFY